MPLLESNNTAIMIQFDPDIDDIFICNKLTINDKKYDLELDDSGLVSRLYIFQSLGNHIFEKIYSKDRWL